jgi:hypothetical protein
MPIPPGRITLCRSMYPPERATDSVKATTAYRSNLTITLSDGRVLYDAEQMIR